MPRRCTICTHTDRDLIDHALLAVDSYRDVARRFAASENALYRHKREHLLVHLAQAHDAKAVAQADTLLAQVQALEEKALDLLTKAEGAGDFRTALQGVRVPYVPLLLPAISID